MSFYTQLTYNARTHTQGANCSGIRRAEQRIRVEDNIFARFLRPRAPGRKVRETERELVINDRKGRRVMEEREGKV